MVNKTTVRTLARGHGIVSEHNWLEMESVGIMQTDIKHIII